MLNNVMPKNVMLNLIQYLVIPGLTRNLLSLLSQYALDYGKHRLHLYDSEFFNFLY